MNQRLLRHSAFTLLLLTHFSARAKTDLPFAVQGSVQRATYAMVGPRAFLGELDRLVRFHEGRGLRVVRMALEDLENAAPKVDASEALRLGVQALDAAAGGTLEYLLLVGDPAPGKAAQIVALPTSSAPKLPYASSDATFPTDFPFGVMAAPPEGGAHRTLAVGRFPASSRAELAAMIDKTLAYTLAPSGLWQRRLALFGGPAKFTPFLDGLIENEARRLLGQVVPYDYDLRFVFAKTDSPYTWRSDALGKKLADEISAGALVSAYFGHGMPNAFDLVDFRDHYYSIGEADELATISVDAGAPVFIALACHVGAFDGQEGEPSLAEVLFRNPKGPVAVIASSRESHPYANALYARALIDVFLTGRASDIGKGLLAVKQTAASHRFIFAEFLVNLDIGALLDEHAGLYNLLGDPALPLRYADALEVSATQESSPELGAHIAVRTRGAGAAVVTLETERDQIREPLEPIDALDLAAAFDAMARNWERANNKLIERLDVVLGQGPISFKSPAEPGKYIVKVFRPGERAAAGHARVEILPIVRTGSLEPAPSLGVAPG